MDGGICSLKKGLEDSNQICLNPNKIVSEQSDQIQELEERLAYLEAENVRLSKDALEKNVCAQEPQGIKEELVSFVSSFIFTTFYDNL